jgi:hypothetical protein
VGEYRSRSRPSRLVDAALPDRANRWRQAAHVTNARVPGQRPMDAGTASSSTALRESQGNLTTGE